MEETRWRGRPVLAGAVRTFAYLVPVICSIIVGSVLSRTLPHASGFLPAVGWWSAVLAASGITVVLVERVARRLLPLSALLGLSLAFPDRAPSRFRVAVRAGGTRRLEERIAAARGDSPDGTPTDAAATILELATLLNTHDRRTRGHSERVRVFADLLGDELQLPEHDRDRLRWAALLHDVGKLTVPAEILNKPGKPTDDEWAVLQGHPDESELFLAPLQGWLGPWVLAATQHHERWDGTGYPAGLEGHDISLSARIVSVADSYEVMTATRAYKRPMSAEAARAELARCAGAQFDPVVVRAFLNISLGRLRFAAGPLAWLAQIPFLGELPRLATGGATLPNIAVAAHTSMASTALAVGASVGAALPAAGGPPPDPAPVAVEADVLDADATRSAGAAVVVTTTTTAAPPAVAASETPPRSESGAEHSQGRGTDEAAAREAERQAEQEQREREQAEREAERQAEAEQRAREQAEQEAQRQAEQEQRERERAEEEARREAERAAREAQEQAERAARDAGRAGGG